MVGHGTRRRPLSSPSHFPSLQQHNRKRRGPFSSSPSFFQQPFSPFVPLLTASLRLLPPAHFSLLSDQPIISSPLLCDCLLSASFITGFLIGQLPFLFFFHYFFQLSVAASALLLPGLNSLRLQTSHLTAQISSPCFRCLCLLRRSNC